MEKKIKKKLIIISDDYEDHEDILKKRVSSGNYFYSEEHNWLEFDVEIYHSLYDFYTPEMVKKQEIDADYIIIDFGLLSYGKWEKAVIKNLNKQCEFIFLCSATANYVEQETRKDEFYKQFPIIDFRAEELLYGVYYHLNSLGMKEKYLHKRTKKLQNR